MKGRPGRLVGRLSLVGVAAALSLAASPWPTQAAVTVGQTFSPGDFCAANITKLQTTSPGSQYVVPSTGGITNWTLTSWSFQAAATPPQLKLKVGRPTGNPNEFTIIGQSGLMAPAANTLNTFSVQIPVKAGDVIGTYTGTSGACQRGGQPGYRFHFELGEPTTATYSLGSDGFQLDVSSSVTPTNTFTLGDVDRNKKKGTATLEVNNLVNPGELVLFGKGLKRRQLNVGGASNVELTVKSKGKKRERLNDTGKVKVKPKVTFTPNGGDANTRSRKFKLRKKL